MALKVNEAGCEYNDSNMCVVRVFSRTNHHSTAGSHISQCAVMYFLVLLFSNCQLQLRG